ncbi:hypothetical protein BROUX41_001783 [Berkeleyomyces rouxiae]|uniref:uncharacterized protein n=1 Tax=Berkeleyomyces rouxiae TaxID=2035830 RepID=UPI003B80FF76
MVTHSYLPGRFSHAGPGYQIPYTDRRQALSHDRRAVFSAATGTSDKEGGNSNEGAPPRKRIAVACSRCRKRKIRCSGDDGTGASCQNCQTAGADQCQFLRVASTETTFRTDDSTFSYNIAAARMHQSVPKGAPPPLSMMTPVVHSPYPDLSTSSLQSHGSGSGYSQSEVMASYHQTSYAPASDKSHSNSGVSTMATHWTPPYGEEQVDCNAMTPYPYSHAPHMVSSTPSYRMPDVMSNKTSHVHQAHHSSHPPSQAYGDVDTAYTYGNSPSAIQRSALNTHTQHYLPYSLPMSTTSAGMGIGDSAERVLPTPQRLASTPGQVAAIYRATGSGHNSSTHIHGQGHGHGHFHHQPHGSSATSSNVSTSVISDVSMPTSSTAYSGVYEMPTATTPSYLPSHSAPVTSTSILSSSVSSTSSIPRSDSTAMASLAETYTTPTSSDPVYSPTNGESLTAASSNSDLAYRYNESVRRTGSTCGDDLALSTTSNTTSLPLHQLSSSQPYDSADSEVAVLTHADSQDSETLVMKQGEVGCMTPHA